MRLPHPARIWLSVLLVAFAGCWSITAPLSALAWDTPQQLPAIPDNIRSPRIAGDNNRFHLVFQQDNAQELYYSRAITNPNGAVVWEPPVPIATGVRYAWNIAAANGTVHVVYASTRNQMVYIVNQQQGNGGAWSAPQVVATLSSRVNDVDIALDEAGEPYIAWGEGSQPSKLVVAYHSVAGTWAKQEESLNFSLVRYPQMAISGRGDSATIHIMTEFQYGSSSAFYIAYTRGGRTSSLQTTAFSQAFQDAVTGNKPTIARDPSSGTLYAGFVTGTNQRGYGLQFSYSINNGQTWVAAGRQALGTDLWADVTPMVADRGTAYLMLPAKQWTGSGFASIGFYDVRYTQATNSFSTPQPIRSNAGTDNGNASPDYDFNSHAKVAVWVTGNTKSIAYNSDPGGRIEPVNATLVVNNGVLNTNNPSVTIELRDVSGNPTQMRVALDGDPTAATPLEPFQTSFVRAFTASDACPRTVAVQLYNISGGQTEILRATINIDTLVQATTLVRNPYKRGNTSSGTLPASNVVDDGDDGYTREPRFYLQINGANECSGLSRLRIGRDATSLSQSYTLGGRFFAGDVPLPAPSPIGPNNLVVEITDGLENVQRTDHTIVYDPIPPVLTTAGTLTVSAPTNGANVLTTLSFSGNVVSDTLYPGRGFWGVWLANSRTPVADPASDTTLSWSSIAAPGLSPDFALKNWSILGGLSPEQQTPGAYYVYARFLDGAGNPTSGVISGTVTIDEVRLPVTLLPSVLKN